MHGPVPGFDFLDFSFANTGYPHTNLMPELLKAVLEFLQTRFVTRGSVSFILEVGSKGKR